MSKKMVAAKEKKQITKLCSTSIVGAGSTLDGLWDISVGTSLKPLIGAKRCNSCYQVTKKVGTSHFHEPLKVRVDPIFTLLQLLGQRQHNMDEIALNVVVQGRNHWMVPRGVNIVTTTMGNLLSKSWTGNPSGLHKMLCRQSHPC